jgi:general secretion pathway protein G
MLHRMRRGARGFTLIEMMVVIAIIGGLVALIISRYTHPLALGKSNSIIIQEIEISKALDQYRLDNGVYPGSGGGVVVTPALFGGAGNQYFNSTPTTYAGNTYIYTPPSTPTEDNYYIETATLVDGSTIPHLQFQGSPGPPVEGQTYSIKFNRSFGGIYAYACC